MPIMHLGLAAAFDIQRIQEIKNPEGALGVELLLSPWRSMLCVILVRWKCECG